MVYSTANSRVCAVRRQGVSIAAPIIHAIMLYSTANSRVCAGIDHVVKVLV